VRAPNGHDYVVEYRESMDWDAGPPSALVVSQAQGSSADLAYPNTHSATFLKSMPIPLNFATSLSVYDGPGFALEILDRSTAIHTVRIRVAQQSAGVAKIVMKPVVDVLNTETTERSKTKFEPGETWCAEGTWPYEKQSRSLKATFACTYARAVAPIRASWFVNGKPIANGSGTIVLHQTAVKLANAKLHDQTAVRDVELRYEVAPLPTGSELHLYNRPQDETFSVDVACTLSTEVGAGDASASARFDGIKFAYPQEFYDKRNRCMYHVADRVSQYKVALSADGWRRVPEERFDQVDRLLDKLALAVGDARQYEKVASALKEELAVATLDIHIAHAVPLADQPMDDRIASAQVKLGG